MKTTHGGSRRGAGKKTGSRWRSTLQKQAAYALYREEVLARMAPLVNAQLDTAIGRAATVAIAELTDSGLKLRRVTDERELEALLAQGKGARIFLSDPDTAMSRYLTDQVIGKASEHLEVTGPDHGPVMVKFVVAS